MCIAIAKDMPRPRAGMEGEDLQWLDFHKSFHIRILSHSTNLEPVRREQTAASDVQARGAYLVGTTPGYSSMIVKRLQSGDRGRQAKRMRAEMIAPDE
jgi:hypothetical protein